jgi:endonuclease/exonuclease/phosphatase family metal-dependent hydrolase
VVSFNVQHGRSVAGPVDVALLAATCAGLDADVLALQEVDRGMDRSGGADLAAEVAAACGMTHAFGPALARGGGEYGNALLVRGTLADVEVVPLPRRDRAEPRVALLARAGLERPGAEVSVAATHLGVDRRESAGQLDTVLAALADRPLPLLLLGDLNRRPRGVRARAERAGLTLAGGPATFPNSRPALRIDHAAVAGLAVGAVAAPATPVSDHRPLVVELHQP